MWAVMPGLRMFKNHLYALTTWIVAFTLYMTIICLKMLFQRCPYFDMIKEFSAGNDRNPSSDPSFWWSYRALRFETCKILWPFSLTSTSQWNWDIHMKAISLLLLIHVICPFDSDAERSEPHRVGNISMQCSFKTGNHNCRKLYKSKSWQMV